MRNKTALAIASVGSAIFSIGAAHAAHGRDSMTTKQLVGAFACIGRFMSSVALATTALIVTPTLGTVSAEAATINWAVWSNVFTPGSTGGSATATMGSTTVAYSGEVISVTHTPSWLPATTFSGGTVGNTPSQSGGAIQLQGGAATSTDTITFSTPVVNPVMAIFSLGQGGLPASFVFASADAFTIQSGGPSAEFGGTIITQSGNSVLGSEGNGTIQFIGTYSTISWTNPNQEFWYAFTVGAPGGTVGAVPLPATLPLFATGLGALGLLGWRRKRKAAA